MGTWDYGSFDNDAALDWVMELERANSSRPIYRVFRRVALAKICCFFARKIDFVDLIEDEAVAACEVVAAWRGKPIVNLPPEIETWLTGRGNVPQGLGRKAAKVVTFLLANSSRRDVHTWGNETGPVKWRNNLEDLQERLTG